MLRRRILQKIRSGVIIIGAMTLAVSFPLLLLPVTAAEKDDDIGNNDIGDGYNYYEKYPDGGCSKTEYRQVETIPVENVLREGQKLFGDTGKRSPFFPCWLDLELFRTGQKFARDNYGQVSFAHMLGIISLLANEQSRRILYSTHRSNTPEKSLKRYTATALHVYIWYNMDIFSPTWVKSVRNIRHIHRGVSAYMGSLYGNNATAYRATKNVRKEEEAEYTPDEDLWKAFELDLASSKYGRLMRNQSLFRDNSTFKHDPKHLYNQYLMSLTQWSFVALPILFPEEITIPRWTDKELLGYAHLWAVISYVLGMDERYILCKNPKDLQGCKKYLRDMLEMYLIPSLFNMDFQGKVLIESLLSTPKFFIPNSHLEYMLIHYLEDILKIDATHLYNRSHLQTRMARWGMKYFWRPLFHWPMFHSLLNFVITGQRQIASMISFNDPATNLTAVAEGMYYLEK